MRFAWSWAVSVSVYVEKELNQQHHYENSGQLAFQMKFHYVSAHFVYLFFLFHFFLVLFGNICACFSNFKWHQWRLGFIPFCTHRLTHFVANFVQVCFLFLLVVAVSVSARLIHQLPSLVFFLSELISFTLLFCSSFSDEETEWAKKHVSKIHKENCPVVYIKITWAYTFMGRKTNEN